MQKRLADLRVGDTVWYKGQTGIYPARVAIVARVSEEFAPNWVQIEWLDIEGGLMVFTVERDLLLEDPSPAPARPLLQVEPVEPVEESGSSLPVGPDDFGGEDLPPAPAVTPAPVAEASVEEEPVLEPASEDVVEGSSGSAPFDPASFLASLTPEQRGQHFGVAAQLSRRDKKKLS